MKTFSTSCGRAGLAAAIAAATSTIYQSIDPAGAPLIPGWANLALLAIAFGLGTYSWRVGRELG